MPQLVNNAAYDIPDARDYPDEEVFGSIDELPARVFHARSPILDQGKTMECTIFSATKWANEVNGIERETIGVPYADSMSTEQLKPYCYKYWYSDEDGGPIVWPIDALRIDLGILKGRTTVKRNIVALKQALIRWPICSGSNTISWSLLHSSNYIVSQITPWSDGHAFEICWYDDNFNTPFGQGAFIVANSYGTDYGRDEGYFYIPYCLIADVTFTWYSLVDASNASPLYRYKANIKGIWNGEDENKNVTRYEASLMAQRTRPEYTGVIWNGKDWDKPVIRQDFITMLSRAIEKPVEWSWDRPTDTMTRGEAAELCGKYL